MITSFALSLAGTFVSGNSILDTWNDIVGDTFGDNSWTDLDQVDFEDATALSSSSLFDGWLTGIDFNDYINNSNAQLQDMLDSIGDTSGMNTSQIVEALEDAGWDPADNGWDEDADLETVLDEMSAMVSNMEVLSWMEGGELDSEFPALEDMESMLTDFGYDDLYSLDDMNDFLNTTVEDALPDSYTDYQMDLDDIEAGLTEIMNGETDAPSIDDVLGEMETMIESMEADVNDGATDLQAPLDALKSVNTALSDFDIEPTDMLHQTAEDLGSLFNDTNFDYGDLNETLGSGWLSDFETAMEDLSSEDVEVDNMRDAVDRLGNLTSYLTVENYNNLDINIVNTSALTKQFNEIIKTIENVTNSEINLDDVGTVISNIDNNGQISNVVENVLPTSQNSENEESESEEPSSPSKKKDDSVGVWLWIVIAVGAFFLIFVVCCYTLYQRNKKLSRIAKAVDGESCAQVEGQSGGTTAGGEI